MRYLGVWNIYKEQKMEINKIFGILSFPYQRLIINEETRKENKFVINYIIEHDKLYRNKIKRFMLEILKYGFIEEVEKMMIVYPNKIDMQYIQSIAPKFSQKDINPKSSRWLLSKIHKDYSAIDYLIMSRKRKWDILYLSLDSINSNDVNRLISHYISLDCMKYVPLILNKYGSKITKDELMKLSLRRRYRLLHQLKIS